MLRVSVPALQQSKIVQLPPTTDSDEARRVLLGKFRHNLDEEQKEGLQLFSVKYNTFLLSVIDNWAPINSVLKQHVRALLLHRPSLVAVLSRVRLAT